MTEALLEHSRREGIRRLVIEFAPEQAASRRLAEKFGFIPAGMSDGLERREKSV